MNTKRISMVMLAALAAILMATAVLHTTRAGANTALIPIGAGYEEETLQLLAQQAIPYNTDLTVTLRILPITYATDPFTITSQERSDNLSLAMNRADQVDAACETIVVSPTTCEATVVDIQIRSDAFDPTRVDQLGSDVDGIYILGGDQTIAMQVVANTPAEDAMETLYLAGAPIGGNSAGSAVQSRYMIGGYTGNNFAWHGLNEGAVDLWYGPITATNRGLKFGLETAVIEQHALERGRIGRLLQAAYLKPGQHVGVGTDWGTGAVIINSQTITQTAGWYSAIVLDEETYGSAANATRAGISQTLSIHNVAFHILPEGPYGYDLTTLRPIVNGTIDSDAPDIITRSLNFFDIPVTAGTLILGGDVSSDPLGIITQRFATLAENANGPTVVIAAGYATDTGAQGAANTWAERFTELGVTEVQTATITASTDPTALQTQLSAAGAFFVISRDQGLLAGQIPLMQSLGMADLLHEGWLAGDVLMLDNAAAALAGDWMVAEANPSDQETYASDSFLADYVVTTEGFGFIPGVSFQPRVLYNYFYGRLVNLVYQHPDTVAFGIEIGTAIEISNFAATVVGDSAVLVIDGRYSRVLEAGTNDAIAATWLLLDTFAPGDTIAQQQVWHTYLPLVILPE